MRVIPGELHALLERCRADDGTAWERFAGWVTTRGRAILGGVDRLSEADGEDAVAETLKSLVTAVRRGEIRGASNAEIDAYVCTAIRRRALNVLRGRARRREVDALTDTPGEVLRDDISRQDARAIAAEQLDRVEARLRSWPAEDRYLFIAKLNGVSARVIRQTLEQPPFGHFIALATIDTRFHRLRQRLLDEVAEP
jgi:DNA-directed RNA polymerase specialized sigma24 family protein